MAHTQTTSETRELSVSIRHDTGKGVARKIRKEGKIPAVFYGFKADPISLVLDPHALALALKTPKKRNTLLRIVSDDQSMDGRLVMVKDVQRHPLSRDLLHVDLIEVYADRPVKAMVPILVHGQAKGVDLGGTLEQHLRYVELKAPAEKIPVSIDIDVTELEIGEGIHLNEIPIGEGLEVLGDHHAAVVSVISPRVTAEAEAGEAGEGEEEAAASGEDKDKDKAPAADAGDKDKGKGKE